MEAEKAPEKTSSSIVKTAIVVGVCILAPAIVGLLVYQFVIAPRLAPSEEPKTPIAEGAYSPTIETIELPQDKATVLSDDPNLVPPLLMYQVAIVCDSLETRTIIEQRLPHFIALVSKLHRNRRLSELNDPYVQESILRQAKQEGNLLLKQFAPEGTHEIIEVMHLSFTLYPL